MALVYAETDGNPHNTITPIARKRSGKFELDLVLRNNLTTAEHPMGLYHPHAELHHIKKENIGLIEVMGLAVLPTRLKDERIAKHADWAEAFCVKYSSIIFENVMDVVKQETGLVFAKVLEHAGIYQRDEVGQVAFLKFIEQVK